MSVPTWVLSQKEANTNEVLNRIANISGSKVNKINGRKFQVWKDGKVVVDSNSVEMEGGSLTVGLARLRNEVERIYKLAQRSNVKSSNEWDLFLAEFHNLLTMRGKKFTNQNVSNFSEYIL